MELLKILYLSLGSLLVLFILTKLMGNREMSQLTMFDYIISITIGSIAAEMSTALESDFKQPLLAMVVYAIVSILISKLAEKSLKARRTLTTSSLILFDNGTLYKENFKKAKLDLNEFLMECRINGYFTLSDIQTAILENNGKISFLPVSSSKPATPKDLNIKSPQTYITKNIILDGKVLKENLESSGNTLEWLQEQIISQGYNNVSEIFLATCDFNNNLNIFPIVKKKNKSHDNFI